MKKEGGFASIGLMYDKQENAVFNPVVLNADNSKNVDLFSRAGDGEVATFQDLLVDRLLDAYQNGELKGRLKEIAAGLNEESNPVIMVIKYR